MEVRTLLVCPQTGAGLEEDRARRRKLNLISASILSENKRKRRLPELSTKRTIAVRHFRFFILILSQISYFI